VPDLVVLVPSRGRPSAARDIEHSFRGTCLGETELWVVVDEDDPTAEEYVRALDGTEAVLATATASRPGRRGMVAALNQASMFLVEQGRTYAIGFMGDDHRPRTSGWDVDYVEALRTMGTGLVYGDDLLQGERLPTQIAMTTDIIRAWGWMAPPTLRHLFADNFWLETGRGAGCLRYLPNVVVEHLHPAAGKAATDPGYAAVNSPEMYSEDGPAFRRLVTGGVLDQCVAKANALQPKRGGHV
jgi:hypothetical protein